MRAAALSLLLIAAPVGAQVVDSSLPTPPSVPRVARVHVQGIPSKEWQQSVRALADSITSVAMELKAAKSTHESADRIGALELRLGALTHRMEGLQSEFGPTAWQLGDLQARLGALKGQFGAGAGRAEAAAGRAEATRGRAAAMAERAVIVRKHDWNMSPGDVKRLIKRVSADPQGVNLPPFDSIASGSFAVAAGQSVGRVAALGDLDVFGTVNGNAVSLDGDVVVHKGAHIIGDAIAVGGTVRLDGGTVDGEMRSLEQAVVPSATAAASSSGLLGILGELQHVMGWLVAMVLLGFGAMVFAEDRLRVVASTIEARFGKSLFSGLIAEVSFIPAIVLAAVLLAVTIIGIVLIPVAIPAIIVVTALLSVLGFLAVSRVAGQALTRRAATVSVRGAELRSMLAGLFFFFGLWAAAALLSWVPVLGSLLHALAFVVTWAAATVGLGAAIVSRGGAGPREAAVAAPSTTPDIGWQTPTPISGIAAARRATSTSSEV